MSTRFRFGPLKELICMVAAADLPPEVHAMRSVVEREFADAINGNQILIGWSIGDVHSAARTAASVDEKRRAAEPPSPSEFMQKIADGMKEEFPDLNVSFGYIGGVGRFGDDRSFRFFCNPPTETHSQSYGSWDLDSLPRVAERLRETNAEEIRKWLTKWKEKARR